MAKWRDKWPLLMPLCAVLIAGIVYAATWSQLRYGAEFSVASGEAADTTFGEIVKGTEIRQRIDADADCITQISILFGTYNRVNSDELLVELYSESGENLYRCNLDTETLPDNTYVSLPLNAPISGLNRQTVVLKITSARGTPGNAVTVYGDSGASQKAQINGEEGNASVCVKAVGKKEISFTGLYWLINGSLTALLAVYSVWVVQRERKGKETFAGKTVQAIRKYWFLLRQLVARDFKTKYKRSALGMLWSLLNPLLTMTVQYIVFSKLFRFEIQNYPVYLLSGIVFFNYMSDATSQAMMCIVQNASLINKVYMPKYIYPFSRVLSCGINFLLSLAALYIMIFASGITVTANHVFLLYGILCTFVFTLGVSFFLSALMVFFRDVQFLYGVFMQLWIYLTPLFYPETILPGWVMRIVEFNPMYHFIRFIRIIILQGVLPEFKAWIYCAVFAIVPFLIGYWVFKKLQSRFILYI